eukprot:m.276887 g.276887  ORF g.276887 m.276887 type:complete len:123 (-) comp15716_c0_seq2:194-562(-)
MTDSELLLFSHSLHSLAVRRAQSLSEYMRTNSLTNTSSHNKALPLHSTKERTRMQAISINASHKQASQSNLLVTLHPQVNTRNGATALCEYATKNGKCLAIMSCVALRRVVLCAVVCCGVHL